MNNDRGIFNVVKIRSILEKLIYNEKYDTIELSMSCSNIGARKNRNIRDHLLVINSILQEVSEDSSKNIDIGIYDVKKCYDKLWFKETANDFYDAGVKDDNFVLVTNANRNCQVAVKTPWGSTSKRTLLQEIEMQGTVLTSLKCSVQIDSLGKDCLKNKKKKDNLYKYLGVVSIPPLSMVDDILTVSEAGSKSIKMNATVQSKIDVKKLELGQSKCFKMNIGDKDELVNTKLMIHGEEMKTTKREKYLGDILSNDGKIDETIKDRFNKGIGVVNQILSILKEISFGSYYFEMALQFRSSMLLNGILFSSEALIGINDKHVDMLEECDLMLMRHIFETPSGTPKESFYLETASIPIRFVLIGRRILFLWSILQKSQSELVKQVYQAQRMFPFKKSWASIVWNDMKNCNINLTEEEISKMKKGKFKTLVKKRIRLKSNEFLLKLQANHTKSINLDILEEPQEYLESEELTTAEKKLLFRLRSRMVDIKSNFKAKFKDDLLCTFCKKKEETQRHLMECETVQNELNLDNSVKADDIFKDIKHQIKALKG